MNATEWFRQTLAEDARTAYVYVTAFGPLRLSRKPGKRQMKAIDLAARFFWEAGWCPDAGRDKPHVARWKALIA